MSDPGESEQELRILATFDEPDPEVERLFISLGRAVTATAAMEQALQNYAVAELTELYPPADERFLVEATRIAGLTGGRILERMRKLGLAVPEHLSAPIDDAIERRNALIHRSFKDLELARAVFDDQSVDPVVERMDQLARDCAGLMFDLERCAVPKLAAGMNMTPEKMVEMLLTTDPETIADPAERQQLLSLQALASIDGMSDALDSLTNPPDGRVGADAPEL